VRQVQPADLLTVQDVRQRFSGSCRGLLTSSPIVSFSPTSASSGELTNNRSAAALFKETPVCVSLPLPANPAKQKRPATSGVDSRTPADSRSTPAARAGPRGADSAARGRPKTAAAAVGLTTFYKPTG